METVIVTVVSAVQVPLVPVTVYVVVVAGPAITDVPAVLLNPAEFAQVYVVAPAAVSDTLSFGQMVALEGVTLTIKLLETVTVTVVSAVQVPVVPVTVYVVVVAGFAVTVAPDVALSPADHAYVVAPLAVSDVLPPGQIVGLAGVTLTAKELETVTVTVAVELQPAAVVPVTV